MNWKRYFGLVSCFIILENSTIYVQFKKKKERMKEEVESIVIVFSLYLLIIYN